MSILTRITTLISANINAMIDSAEDPEKMVTEYLRQMREGLSDARAATAMAMADETRLRSYYERYKSESEDWGRKAEMAVQADQDDLAREALTRRASAQKLADNYQAQWESQHDQVGDLREALAKLEAKISEAETKRDLIIAKQRRAATQEAITNALQSMDGQTADASLDRMETEVDQRLARAQAMAELSGQDLDSRFSDLETENQVNNDLAELKRKFNKA
ncbi:MAG: PspA/IM30 family protein [Chloroflexota bacterium]|jgi:phage shock protein A|nr:PspA/IM30 family protein [Chloroflexota bacterium]MDQ5864647.1 PspA/IM30 family protein [Chloroflexota bacterium]